MSNAERAVAWARETAADNAHGYSQANRWGPDYDCSSFVITAFKQAGVPLSCTYTGNMRRDMLRNGFTDVTGSVDLASGAGVQLGDVLLNDVNHTALCIGPGRIVQARSDYDGQTGDGSGREIGEGAYYNYPWDCVLRYTGDSASGTAAGASPKAGAVTDDSGTYIVQKGDSLWDIADKVLGSGLRWKELQRINGLSTTDIRPGQVLRIREAEPPQAAAGTQGDYWPPRLLKLGMTGPDVSVAQAVLTARGYYTAGISGSYDNITVEAVMAFQAAEQLAADGVAGPLTWGRLLRREAGK